MHALTRHTTRVNLSLGQIGHQLYPRTWSPSTVRLKFALWRSSTRKQSLLHNLHDIFFLFLTPLLISWSQDPRSMCCVLLLPVFIANHWVASIVFTEDISRVLTLTHPPPYDPKTLAWHEFDPKLKPNHSTTMANTSQNKTLPMNISVHTISFLIMSLRKISTTWLITNVILRRDLYCIWSREDALSSI